MDLNFDALINAGNELELKQAIRALIPSYGAEWFVFVSLYPTDRSPARSTHRFLIGCMPSWCHLYVDNRWYLTDPCLEYARSNTEPISGDVLPVHTSGQRNMLDAAADHGFRSIYIVPAHSSEKGRIGILYLGSSADRGPGEARLRSGRPFFRALALELLDWSSKSVKQDALEMSGLTGAELNLLALARSGFSAADIARERDVSPRSVYRQFQQINGKVGVAHITAAVKFAEEHDLIT